MDIINNLFINFKKDNIMKIWPKLLYNARRAKEIYKDGTSDKPLIAFSDDEVQYYKTLALHHQTKSQDSYDNKIATCPLEF